MGYYEERGHDYNTIDGLVALFTAEVFLSFDSPRNTSWDFAHVVDQAGNLGDDGDYVLTKYVYAVCSCYLGDDPTRRQLIDDMENNVPVDIAGYIEAMANGARPVITPEDFADRLSRCPDNFWGDEEEEDEPEDEPEEATSGDDSPLPELPPPDPDVPEHTTVINNIF